MSGFLDNLVTAPVHGKDDLWAVTSRVAVAFANPYADKLTLALNEGLEDIFNLKNNFAVQQDRKTGKMLPRGGLKLTTKALQVKLRGVGTVRLRGLEGGIFLDKHGQASIKIPVLGYDWQIGGHFDPEKALSGAKAFAKKLLDDNFSLVQNAIFPEKLDRFVDDWIKKLPPSLQAPVRSFADVLQSHGEQAVGEIIKQISSGNFSKVTDILSKELKSLQKDLAGMVKRTGSSAVNRLSQLIQNKLSKYLPKEVTTKLKATLDHTLKEPWQLAQAVTKKVLGVAAPYGDSEIVAWNDKIQDVFNLANNTLDGKLDAVMSSESLQQISSYMAVASDLRVDDLVSQLSYVLGE